jgi:hypothetical protein
MTNDNDELIGYIQQIVNKLYSDDADISEFENSLKLNGYNEAEIENIRVLAKGKLIELLKGKFKKVMRDGIVLLVMGLVMSLMFVAPILVSGHLYRHAVGGIVVSLLLLGGGLYKTVNSFETKTKLKEISVT